MASKAIADSLPSLAGDRLRLELLREPARVHVHSEPVLPRPGGHPRSQVRHGHRHVESGVHPLRTAHGAPATAWGGKWGGGGSFGTHSRRGSYLTHYRLKPFFVKF